MKFSKEYSKLQYPIFTTIRQDKGYYRERDRIKVETPSTSFWAEIVSIRHIDSSDITSTIALRDADCSRDEIIQLFKYFYKTDYNNLILITLMKVC